MKKILFYFTLASIVAIQACKEEANEIGPGYFEVISATTDDRKSARTGLKVMFSRDFKNYTESLGAIRTGTKVWARVYTEDTEEALSLSDFSYEWAGSSLVNTINGVAEFDVKSDLKIHVKVSDAFDLVASRTDGTFHRINKENGEIKPLLLTATYQGQPISWIEAFAYHPKNRRYYASVKGSANAGVVTGGYLYTMDPTTGIMMRINENTGGNGASQWENVYDWEIDKDDSLVSIGDFETDGFGLAKFGLNGQRAHSVRNAQPCCGGGLVLDTLTNQLLISNGATNVGEIELQSVTRAANPLSSTKIYTFNKFPSGVSITSYSLTLNDLARDKDGTLYGIMMAVPQAGIGEAYYCVKVDTHAGTVTHLSTLSDLADPNQFNALALVPKHLARTQD